MKSKKNCLETRQTLGESVLLPRLGEPLQPFLQPQLHLSFSSSQSPPEKVVNMFKKWEVKQTVKKLKMCSHTHTLNADALKQFHGSVFHNSRNHSVKMWFGYSRPYLYISQFHDIESGLYSCRKPRAVDGDPSEESTPLTI